MADLNRPHYRVVTDDLRKLSTAGKWAEVLGQITVGRTVFIGADEHRKAANALAGAVKSRGMRLRRKMIEFEGERGSIFWAEKPLGN